MRIHIADNVRQLNAVQVRFHVRLPKRQSTAGVAANHTDQHSVVGIMESRGRGHGLTWQGT
jgi:hypothetical protein